MSIGGSIGEALLAAHAKVEIDARQQSYAVATEITKSIAGKHGSADAKNVGKYWEEIANIAYKKIAEDMKAIGVR